MLIYGKQVAADTRAEIATGVAAFEKKYCRKPCLAVIIVGEDPASQTYVRNKIKGCAEVGMASLSYEYGDTTPQEEIAAMTRDICFRSFRTARTSTASARQTWDFSR